MSNAAARYKALKAQRIEDDATVPGIWIGQVRLQRAIEREEAAERRLAEATELLAWLAEVITDECRVVPDRVRAFLEAAK